MQLSIEQEIKPWQAYRHKSGATYVVLAMTNKDGLKPGYPRRVVYFNIDDVGTLYSAEESDWHRRMTLDKLFTVGRLLKLAVIGKLAKEG